MVDLITCRPISGHLLTQPSELTAIYARGEQNTDITETPLNDAPYSKSV